MTPARTEVPRMNQLTGIASRMGMPFMVLVYDCN